ncbi:MAG: 4-hydroxythreonine-4-phosphate dehydrogenase PdxA [Prevotellaceae bacterium]|nr:4-hydroxythreonine-4-phosphate dehydrogenase PdxA [Prevotellaceae bacterium]
MQKVKIGITHGDINGVGYEVIFKAFADEEMLSLCTPVIYGSPKVATYHRKAIESQTNFALVSSAADARDGVLSMVNCFGDAELKIEYGKPSEEAGMAAYVALENAMKALTDGEIDVLVTAPINKRTIQNEDFSFPGHTEYIEHRVGEGNKALMLLMNEQMRVALVTTHLPLSEVAKHITQAAIEEKLQILHDTLKRDFAIDNPRIAVLSLNPHAGEDGFLGTEEQTQIIPAIESAFARGIRCFGPYAADGFFGSGNYARFDAVLAMYHDQGLAPLKALSMSDGVNYTAGLPVIRTSPDHGTAYDIAGKNVADESSFRKAIYAAIDIFRNRLRYDQAHAHPLRKQYYEKRDDSDKLKLNQTDDDATM